MLDTLDATAVRQWCAAACGALRRHRDEIDALNVYPVPDADTGTNLASTLAAANEALTSAPADASAGAALRTLARGALLGAQGNSGAIVAQLFSGLAAAVAADRRVTGRQFAAALADAADAARAAVMEPAEGTILTVARAAADGARERVGDGLTGVVTGAATAAAAALAGTPRQLVALAAAGVVDAGGRGLVVVLDALVGVVTGVVPQRPAEPPPHDQTVPDPIRHAGSSRFGYEVQYLLDAATTAISTLRTALAALGDSLMVLDTGTRSDGVGGATGVPVWNVHVHVDDVGAAIEAGIEAGRPHRIRVSRFADAATAEEGAAHLSDAGGRRQGGHNAQVTAGSRAVVALAPKEGLAALFAAEGAHVVPVPVGVVADQVIASIRATPAREITVLAHDVRVHDAVREAAVTVRAAGYLVSVVPSRSPVQALAALAVRDPGRRFDDDVIAMADAAGACRCAEMSVAARDALTVARRCQAGDSVALVDGEVVVVGADPVATARELLDRMLGAGGELATVVFGAAAPEQLRRVLPEHLATRWPFVETRVYDGGQPDHLLLVGVE